MIITDFSSYAVGTPDSTILSNLAADGWNATSLSKLAAELTAAGLPGSLTGLRYLAEAITVMYEENKPIAEAISRIKAIAAAGEPAPGIVVRSLVPTVTLPEGNAPKYAPDGLIPGIPDAYLGYAAAGAGVLGLAWLLLKR